MFKERLKEAIKTAGMTEAELAERSGIPYQTIRNYMSRATLPTANIIIRLCQTLKVSADFLLEIKLDDSADSTERG